MTKMVYEMAKQILDIAFTAAIGDLTSYVITWCWNHAKVQEMRRKFEGILFKAERVNPRANCCLQRLLRQLEDEAQQGKELLDGEPTAFNLSNAKEKFERIQVLTVELNQLLLVNAREVPTLFAVIHPKIKRPQFKPRYLQRRTRIQVIRNCNIHQDGSR